jgi:hypothetical protein
VPFPADVPQSQSVRRTVSAAGDAMVVDDAGNDPRLATHPLVARAHVNVVAAAPLHHDGYIVGALGVTTATSSARWASSTPARGTWTPRPPAGSWSGSPAGSTARPGCGTGSKSRR